jgi:hypothetical protein
MDKKNSRKDSVLLQLQVLEFIMRETHKVDTEEWDNHNRSYTPYKQRCKASSLIINQNTESPVCWRSKVDGKSHCIVHESYTNMLSELSHVYDIYIGRNTPLGHNYTIPRYLILNSPDMSYEDFKIRHNKYNSMYHTKFGYILYTLITTYVVHVRNFRSRWQLMENTKSNKGHKNIYDTFEKNMKYMSALFGITINVNRSYIVNDFETQLVEDLGVIRRLVELIDELIKNKEKYYYLSTPINIMYAAAVREQDLNPIMTMIYNYPINVRPEFKLTVKMSLLNATYAITYSKRLPYTVANMLLNDGVKDKNVSRYHKPILDGEVIKLPSPVNINTLGYAQEIEEDHSHSIDRKRDMDVNYQMENTREMRSVAPSMSPISSSWYPSQVPFDHNH